MGLMKAGDGMADKAKVVLWDVLSIRQKLLWKIGDAVDWIAGKFRYRVDWMCDINDWFVQRWFSDILGMDLKEACRRYAERKRHD